MSVQAFLDAAGWGSAHRDALAGDASARRYSRLAQDGQTAILMEDPDGDTARFAAMASHLRAAGLGAPKVYAGEPGLLLLEDLGDDLVARIAKPDTEPALYALAADALIEVQAMPVPPELPVADAPTLAALTGLTFETYGGSDTARREAETAFAEHLSRLDGLTEVTILRDYHAENILLLPDRDGTARAGLLDFQDAMRGHRAYDLVSLLQDARRDVAPGTVAQTRRHFLDRTGLDAASFDRAYALLGAQRNLRILGVFARLARARGKPGYLALIPRVWGHLQADLAHPDLADLRAILSDLPAPTPDHLQGLR